MPGRNRFRPLPIVALLALAAMLAVPSAATAKPCKHAAAKPGTANERALRTATRCLLNKKRRAHGLQRLRGNGRLHRAANRHGDRTALAHCDGHPNRRAGHQHADTGGGR